MALAFHSALSDGAIGSDEVEETKAGLRAALAAAPAQPAPKQGVQEPVATIEHTLGGSIQYCPLNEAAYKLPMGVEFKLYTAQPTPSGDVEDAARYRYLRDGDWREHEELESVIRLQLNTLWDAKIDAARAAQEGK